MSFIKFPLLALVICVVLANIINVHGGDGMKGDDGVDYSPLVALSQGKIRGLVKKSRGGRNYFAYLGIPYSEPPKRFKNSEIATTKWEGVRDGTKWGSDCVQKSWTTGKPYGNESSCLVLNVFTPRLELLDNNKPLSTIVFIHGGGFSGGSGSQYGVEYFMNEDVVFVSINYRLSALGFLNTEDDETDANVGLKDQSIAMMWVRDNILNFGGNPKDITIYGGSAGAASVALHILSPYSAGLFTKAISGSGSGECPWAIVSNPRENAKKLALQVNCPTESSADMVKCLQEKDAGELVDKSFTELAGWNLDPMAIFAPSIEYVSSPGKIPFLPDSPKNLYAQGKINKVVWLTGTAKNEGLALHSASIINSPDVLKKLNDDWNTVAPITFSFNNVFPKDKWPLISNKIREFYFGNDKFPIKNNEESAKILEQLYSDRNFFHGIRKSILNHAKNNIPVYPYFFDYIGHKSWLETIMKFNTYGGVAHGDDFAYFLKFYMDPNDPKSAQELEPNSTAEEMSRKLVKLWMSFVNTGKPVSSWLPTDWKSTSLEEATSQLPLQWYHLDKIPGSNPETENFTKRMQFWTDLELQYSSQNSNDGYQVRSEL